MSSTWLDRVDVERLLRSEAAGIATHLGHRMGAWDAQRDRGLATSRCMHCGDAITVAARSFRRSPIAGAAVQLRCAGPRAGAGAARPPAALGR
jgi:hypothetical protein